MVSSFLWILVTAGLLFWLNSRSGSALAFTATLVLVPLACVLVRLATIGAITITSGSWLNRYAPVIAGGCAGCVLITAAVSNRWLYASPMIGGLWALFVPSMFGLAAGFAEIDQSGPARRVAGPFWQKLSYGAVIVVVCAVMLASRFSSAGPYSPTTITDTGKPRDQHLLPVTNSPTLINLVLNSNQLIGWQALHDQTYCSAVITDNATGNAVVNLNVYSYQKKKIPKGNYKLTVNPSMVSRIDTPDDVLKVFNNQFMERFGRKLQTDTLCTVDLTLNLPD
jgi:hypothetical protein